MNNGMYGESPSQENCVKAAGSWLKKDWNCDMPVESSFEMLLCRHGAVISSMLRKIVRMEHQVTLMAAHLELEQIEQTLRERFLETHAERRHFIVRFIGTNGEIGRRCLTFNIEVRENEFLSEKMYLEKFVDDLRSQGWDIDELRQPLKAGDNFDARLWLMIYEEHNAPLTLGEGPQ